MPIGIFDKLFSSKPKNSERNLDDLVELKYIKPNIILMRFKPEENKIVTLKTKDINHANQIINKLTFLL
jgi:hypothetical protein